MSGNSHAGVGGDSEKRQSSTFFLDRIFVGPRIENGTLVMNAFSTLPAGAHAMI